MAEFKAKLAVATLLLVGMVALSGCDRTDDRVSRAQTVAEAALDQIAGAGEAPAGPARMADVAIEARAFAGDRPQDATPYETPPRARFAIGSIVAKPRDVPPLPSPAEALVMQAPELEPELRAEGLIVDAEDIAPQPEVARDSTQTAPQRPRVRAPQPLTLPQGLPMEQRRLARRAVMTERSVEVQANARSLMLDAMSDFGLSGQVETTRTGAMVIQIGDDGADPTQFRPRQLPPPPAQAVRRLFTAEGATRADLPRMALEARQACPDNATAESLRGYPVLATQCMVERLAQSGEFEYVEKDFIFDHQFLRRPAQPPVTAAITPDDPLWSLQWHFFNNGNGDGESPGGAGFVEFWGDGGSKGSRDVVVAVVDTGLDMDHPDIMNSLNIAPGWDMVSDPRMGNDGDGRDPDANDPGDLCDPTIPFAEDSYHGTHVAGTIGAAMTNDATGVAAGAWNVKIVPVRALGKCGGRLTDINDAIRWAGGLVPAIDADGDEVWNENPADIINLSIGLFESCPASLQEAINAVSERGAVVVSAAGNARISTEFYAPGGCENVISVAAGDARGAMAPYSNYGAEVDVLAPGGDLTRDDNGDGRPDGVLSTRVAMSCVDPVSGDPVDTCYYAFEQGTSMAAPHVSAALALLKAREPDLIGSSLTDRLLSALSPRTLEQCAGPCDDYIGAEQSAEDPDLCLRPCGGGLLNLQAVLEVD